MLTTLNLELARQFDALAAGWDARYGPDSTHRFEFAARIRYLRALCGGFNRPRVLDLGCATGHTLHRLSDLFAAGVGVDISPLMILHARRTAALLDLRLTVDNAAEFCNKCREQFDLILLIGVLAHLPNQAATLAAAPRVLSPGGRLILISPHPWNPWFLYSRMTGRQESPPARHLSPVALQKLAAGAELDLYELHALPFGPWSNFLSAPPHERGQRRQRLHRFVGLVQGAFAAQFCPAGRQQRNDAQTKHL
jgi:SAM-dependent methyltransferase